MDKKKIAVIVVGGVAILYYLSMGSAKPNPYKAKTAYGDAVGGATSFIVPPASNDNSVHYDIKMPDMEAPIINNTLPSLPAPSGFNSSGGSGGSSGGSSYNKSNLIQSKNTTPTKTVLGKTQTELYSPTVNAKAKETIEPLKGTVFDKSDPFGLYTSKPKTDYVSKPTQPVDLSKLFKPIFGGF